MVCERERVSLATGAMMNEGQSEYRLHYEVRGVSECEQNGIVETLLHRSITRRSCEDFVELRHAFSLDRALFRSESCARCRPAGSGSFCALTGPVCALTGPVTIVRPPLRNGAPKPINRPQCHEKQCKNAGYSPFPSICTAVSTPSGSAL